MKKSIKTFLMTLLSVLLVFSCIGFIACSSEDTVEYGFNDKLASSYFVNETIDVEKTVDLPLGKTYSMTAEYQLDGQTKKYLSVGLTFKPTHLGEVKITVTCDGKDYKATVMIVEQPPTLVNVDTALYVLGETVELTSIANKVTVVPFDTQVKVTKVRYAGGEEVSLDGQTEYTFNLIGNYEFYYEASNTSGKIDGYITAVVSREITANEVNDLTNTIKQMVYSTVVQSEEHSENSDWSWKVSATPDGTYNGGGNFTYWLSRVYIDFGQTIDLSKQYFEMDVWASENTYEGGVLIYYSPGSSSQLEWHVCPGTTYNNWKTISTQRDDIRNNPERTNIKVRGVIISVLHRQQGEYDKENVYYLFDNLVVKEYRDLGVNEINDLTNKTAGSSMGVTYRLDETQKTADSDWSYKLYTSLPSKASDYPYVDLSLGGGNKSMSDYDFSFFVKTNAAYDVKAFKIVTLYLNDNNVLTWGTEYTMAIEPNSWNYISSLNINIKEKNVCSIRIQLNTATTDVRDIVMWVDNLKLVEKTAAETQDFSNSLSVNSGNSVSYGMSSDKSGTDSGWAWNVTGRHFDYFKVTFDNTYSFANAYFKMDLKPVDNFGGIVVVQFIAEDGSVKKDWVFDSVPTSGEFVTLSTESDTTQLLANYKAANIYLLAEEIDKEVSVIIDNVNVVNRGLANYIAVDADDWTIVNGTGEKTITLNSFSGGEKFVQYYKEGGYTNQFIDVDLTLNGTKNPDWAFGMRIENVGRYGLQPYGRQGFYIKLNDGFFTLYGPTFLGEHCGSYNYPNGMENCTTLRMGIISNNDFVQAFLYFLKEDGSILGTYTWKNMNTTSGPNSGVPIDPELVKAGSFVIYSLKGTQTTLTVSDPYDYVPAPSVTTDTEKATFSGYEFADKLMYRVNGGAWAELSGTTYKPTGYGKFIVEAKSVIGTSDSEITKAELIILENPIEFVNLSNVEFVNAPNHQSGAISYSTPGAYRTGEGVISLKGDFTNQMIKVGFTATSTNIADAKISIGLRESISAANAPNYGDEIRKNTFRFSNFDFGTAYAALCCYETNYYSDQSGAKHELDLYKSSSFGSWKSLIAGNKYYVAAGMYTGNDVTYAYYALLDSNNSPLRIIRWDVDAIASAQNVTIPTSGYFNIYTYKTTDSITYEIVDAETVVGAYDKVVISQGTTKADLKWTAIPWADGYEVSVNGGSWTDVQKSTTYSATQGGVFTVKIRAYKGTVKSAESSYIITNIDEEFETKNMSSMSMTVSGNVKTITFTPNSGLGGGHQPTTAAGFAFKQNYDDEFVKLGFKPTAANFVDNRIAIGLRATSMPANFGYHQMGWNLRAFNFGGGNYQMSLSATGASDNNYKGVASATTSLDTTKTYYIIAGVVNGTDTNKTVYWALTADDGTVLDSKTWTCPGTLNGSSLAMADSGYFTVASWYATGETPTEKVYTYEILSKADGLAACGVSA